MAKKSKAHAPLRVLHILGAALHGGTESVVYNYYRAIDRTKIQFDIAIDHDSPYDVPEDIINLGCRVYRIPSYKKLFSYITAIKKICREGGYLIIHSHMNAMSVFTLYAAKCAGVPIRIAHSHSTGGSGEYKKNLIKNILRPFSQIYPTHLFACSEYAGRWLFGSKIFDQGKVTIIRNAIDVEKFRFDLQTRIKVRCELGIDDKFVIGHVGRFMKQKNHEFLIDIFAEVLKLHKDSVLILAGEGELKRQIIDKAQKLGLSNNIKFLGIRDDVPDLYQAMDAFVLPSLYEGLPVVGVEAQCAGLPCVLSNDITKETISSKITQMLTLSLGAAKWAEEMVRCIEINSDRSNFSKAVCLKWDILKESDKLLSTYLNIAQVTYDKITIDRGAV